ncbi:MAG TPA: Asp-tRNA(Asn)/Glu-tRNA(Gln) amidotransferase subunit GatC [Saprospiraceae bacterium]|nr:Asp-tRNA(Asn)/Glu-tRNA(Gln) amidotransferase subunit GatC [Saprospiraceae bacterium]
MQIDHSLILRLEHLARLELSKDERATIRQDLNDILTMVEQLQDLPTDEVEPLVYLNPDVNVWREDQVKDQVSRTAALKNAPSQDGTYFTVPKVIDLK